MKTQSPEDSSDITITVPSAPRRFGRSTGPLFISLVVHGALAVAGLFWILKILPAEEKPDIAISGGRGGSSSPNPALPKQQKALAHSNLARVAAVGATSPVSLPVPEAAGSQLGSISGSVGGSGAFSGPSSGELGGNFPGPAIDKGKGPMIFEIRGQAPQRVAYVLDFSITMVGEKDSLMRRELEKSLKALPSATKYSVICFSGPVWLPGDEVTGHTVKSNGKTYEWTAKSMWEWTSSSPRIQAPWTAASEAAVKRTLKLVDDVKSIGGTDWEAPLEVAIAMEPPPQTVFFMTDGVMEQRDMLRLTRGIAAKAKSRGVTINTVALMEPGAEEPMADLAKRTGGLFTIVEKDGKVIRKSRN